MTKNNPNIRHILTSEGTNNSQHSLKFTESSLSPPSPPIFGESLKEESNCQRLDRVSFFSDFGESDWSPPSDHSKRDSAYQSEYQDPEEAAGSFPDLPPVDQNHYYNPLYNHQDIEQEFITRTSSSSIYPSSCLSDRHSTGSIVSDDGGTSLKDSSFDFDSTSSSSLASYGVNLEDSRDEFSPLAVVKQLTENSISKFEEYLSSEQTKGGSPSPLLRDVTFIQDGGIIKKVSYGNEFTNDDAISSHASTGKIFYSPPLYIDANETGESEGSLGLPHIDPKFKRKPAKKITKKRETNYESEGNPGNIFPKRGLIRIKPPKAKQTMENKKRQETETGLPALTVTSSVSPDPRVSPMPEIKPRLLGFQNPRAVPTDFFEKARKIHKIQVADGVAERLANAKVLGRIEATNQGHLLRGKNQCLIQGKYNGIPAISDDKVDGENDQPMNLTLCGDETAASHSIGKQEPGSITKHAILPAQLEKESVDIEVNNAGVNEKPLMDSNGSPSMKDVTITTAAARKNVISEETSNAALQRDITRVTVNDATACQDKTEKNNAYSSPEDQVSNVISDDLLKTDNTFTIEKKATEIAEYRCDSNGDQMISQMDNTPCSDDAIKLDKSKTMTLKGKAGPVERIEKGNTVTIEKKVSQVEINVNDKKHDGHASLFNDQTCIIEKGKNEEKEKKTYVATLTQNDKGGKGGSMSSQSNSPDDVTVHPVKVETTTSHQGDIIMDVKEMEHVPTDPVMVHKEITAEAKTETPIQKGKTITLEDNGKDRKNGKKGGTDEALDLENKSSVDTAGHAAESEQCSAATLKAKSGSNFNEGSSLNDNVDSHQEVIAELVQGLGKKNDITIERGQIGHTKNTLPPIVTHDRKNDNQVIQEDKPPRKNKIEDRNRGDINCDFESKHGDTLPSGQETNVKGMVTSSQDQIILNHVETVNELKTKDGLKTVEYDSQHVIGKNTSLSENVIMGDDKGAENTEVDHIFIPNDIKGQSNPNTGHQVETDVTPKTGDKNIGKEEPRQVSGKERGDDLVNAHESDQHRAESHGTPSDKSDESELKMTNERSALLSKKQDVKPEKAIGVLPKKLESDANMSMKDAPISIEGSVIVGCKSEPIEDGMEIIKAEKVDEDSTQSGHKSENKHIEFESNMQSDGSKPGLGSSEDAPLTDKDKTKKVAVEKLASDEDSAFTDDKKTRYKENVSSVMTTQNFHDECDNSKMTATRSEQRVGSSRSSTGGREGKHSVIEPSFIENSMPDNIQSDSRAKLSTTAHNSAVESEVGKQVSGKGQNKTSENNKKQSIISNVDLIDGGQKQQIDDDDNNSNNSDDNDDIVNEDDNEYIDSDDLEAYSTGVVSQVIQKVMNQTQVKTDSNSQTISLKLNEERSSSSVIDDQNKTGSWGEIQKEKTEGFAIKSPVKDGIDSKHTLGSVGGPSEPPDTCKQGNRRISSETSLKPQINAAKECKQSSDENDNPKTRVEKEKPPEQDDPLHGGNIKKVLEISKDDIDKSAKKGGVVGLHKPQPPAYPRTKKTMDRTKRLHDPYKGKDAVNFQSNSLSFGKEKREPTVNNSTRERSKNNLCILEKKKSKTSPEIIQRTRPPGGNRSGLDQGGSFVREISNSKKLAGVQRDGSNDPKLQDVAQSPRGPQSKRLPVSFIRERRLKQIAALRNGRKDVGSRFNRKYNLSNPVGELRDKNQGLSQEVVKEEPTVMAMQRTAFRPHQTIRALGTGARKLRDRDNTIVSKTVVLEKGLSPNKGQSVLDHSKPLKSLRELRMLELQAQRSIADKTSGVIAKKQKLKPSLPSMLRSDAYWQDGKLHIRISGAAHMEEKIDTIRSESEKAENAGNVPLDVRITLTDSKEKKCQRETNEWSPSSIMYMSPATAVYQEVGNEEHIGHAEQDNLRDGYFYSASQTKTARVKGTPRGNFGHNLEGTNFKMPSKNTIVTESNRSFGKTAINSLLPGQIPNNNMN